MSNVNTHIQSFAGGEIGPLMVGRLDLNSYQQSCALMENFLPLAQGGMTRRNGLAYLDSWGESALYNRIFKFEYDIGQNYILSPRTAGFYFYTNDAELLLPETQPGAWSTATDASGTSASVGSSGGGGGGGGFRNDSGALSGNGGAGGADANGTGGGGGGGAGIGVGAGTPGNGGNGVNGGGGGAPGAGAADLLGRSKVNGTPGSGGNGHIVLSSGGNQLVLSTPGPGSFIVPSWWNSASNTIYGYGSGSGGTYPVLWGGGGGAFAGNTNQTLTIGATVYYSIGLGGAPNTDGQDTWLNAATNAAPSSATNGILAKGASGATGGASSACVGNAKYSGGSAGSSNYYTITPFLTTLYYWGGGGGGGGAGGPAGAGPDGGSAAHAVINNSGNLTSTGGLSGGGGAGASGGSAGVGTTSGSNGGPGGNGSAGFGSGTGGTRASINGASGGSYSASGAGTYPLVSVGSNAAIARFMATVRPQDCGTVHVVTFQLLNEGAGQGLVANIGLFAGDNSLGIFPDLRQGFHQLAFVPPLGTSTVYLEVRYLGYGVRTITQPQWLYQGAPGAGAVPYTLPYAAPQMSSPADVRLAQDGNELWLFSNLSADNTSIIRRLGTYAWSNILFLPDDGPFDGTYGDPAIEFSVSDIAGQQTLTCTNGNFNNWAPGQLIRLFQFGQGVKEVIARDSYYTQPIRVSGIGVDRAFNLTLAGTFVGTVTLQRSNGNQNAFVGVLAYTSATNVALNDVKTGNALYTASVSTGNWDNTVAYYRLAIEPGNYASGAVTASLTYSGGSTLGIARIVRILTPTTALVDITQPFGSTANSNIWQQSIWQAGSNMPQCGTFGKGRLFTAAGRQVASSNSDNFLSFTDGMGGSTSLVAPQADNTSIVDTITSRSAVIAWLACLDYLCVGTHREENVAYSAVPTQAMTPSTFIADFMTQEGGAPIDPLTLAYSIIFAHRTGRRLYKFSHNLRSLSAQAFIAKDLTRLHPEMAKSGIIRFDASEEPERRIYVVLGDGTVRPLLYREEEEIEAWALIVTQIGGIIDDVVMHEADEDRPYFLIRTPTPLAATPYTYTLVRLPRERPVNPWDHRYLDNHVTTPYRQGVGNMLPTALVPQALGGPAAVTVYSDKNEFQSGDVGSVLWIDDGRILINSVAVGNGSITGVVQAPLTGAEGPANTQIPALVGSNRWMIAGTTSTITFPAAFRGWTVGVYADLAYLGTFIVPTGLTLALPVSASRIVAGLPMSSRWQSLKLAYGAQKGTAVGQKKKVIQLDLVLDTCGDGLMMGRSFADLLPLEVDRFDPNALQTPLFFTGEINDRFNSELGKDPRICFEIDTPHPCTVLGFVANIETHER